MRELLVVARIPDPYVVGPCLCQGCGGAVVWINEPDAQGWLHEDGRLACPQSFHVRQGEERLRHRREYKKAWAARKRAALKEET